MTLLHVRPVHEGRRLNSAQRAALLMREGERWVALDDLADLAAKGEEIRIEAIIWHGDYGSILRGPRDHIEGG